MINRDGIINACREELGQHEEPIGSNKTKYGIWYGMNTVPWCAMYVAYCFSRSGYPLHIDKGFKGFHYVPILHGQAKLHGWLTDTPQKGDIVLFDFKPNDGREFAQHVGIYSGEQNKLGHYYCYEGNTSSGEHGSQDNGDCVAFKARQKQFILGFVDAEKMIDSWITK